MEIEERKRIGKMFLINIAIALLIGSWLATQGVAKDCFYDPVLGKLRIHMGEMYLYLPYEFWIWKHLYEADIPHIIAQAEKRIYLTFLGFTLLSILQAKYMKILTTHGSADWATKEDIIEAKVSDEEGVILGINPYTKKILRHNGPEHVLLMAPTRSGKGINTIIPTCLTWQYSLFVLDVKGENWEKTAGYRKNVMKQTVMKFEPLSTNGSSLKWNPLAEINYRSDIEFSDVQNLVNLIVDPDGKGQLDYWSTTGSALLCGSILHLLYSHHQENRPIPSMTDLARFLSNPERSMDEQLDLMKNYPHITVEEFLSEDNVLQQIYGEYIKDFTPFNEMLGIDVHTLDELKKELKTRNINYREDPYRILLVHPKVAESAAEMKNKATNEKSGVLSTAKSFLNLYQNPVIQKNTSISEFKIKDLLDSNQKVSFYLVIPYKEIKTLRPLCRLLINSILNGLIGKLELNDEEKDKKRLLLMLDEFPQFGRLDTVESALAVCAGYGIKICVVCQDSNQLNKAYTKENSLSSNCHVHIYLTPNLDGGVTASFISKMLGKRTILIQSSTAQDGLLKGSTSTSAMGRDLMTPDEVNKMKKNRALIFVAGNKPILAKKLRYYKEPYFEKRVLPMPKFSDKSTIIDSFEAMEAIHANERAKEKQEREEIEKAKLLEQEKKN